MFKSEQACDKHAASCPQRFQPLLPRTGPPLGTGPSAGGDSSPVDTAAPVLAAGEVDAPGPALDLGCELGHIGLNVEQNASIETFVDTMLDPHNEQIPDVGDLHSFLNSDSTDFGSYLASI